MPKSEPKNPKSVGQEAMSSPSSSGVPVHQNTTQLGSSVKKALPTAANSSVSATSPGVTPSNPSGSNSQVQTSSTVSNSNAQDKLTQELEGSKVEGVQPSAVKSTSAKPNIQGKAYLCN